MTIRNLVSCSDLARSLSPTLCTQLTGGEDYRRSSPRFLETSANSQAENAQLAELLGNNFCSARAVRAFRLSRARVFGQGTVLTTENDILLDSAAEFINHAHPPDGSSIVDNTLVVHETASPLELGGTSLLVKRPWFRNFGHWLVDLVPLMALAADRRLKIDHVILGEVPDGALRDMMTETARYLLPNANQVFMPDDAIITCDALEYIEPVHVPPLYKNPVAIQAMVDALDRVFPGGEQQTRRKVYVSRANAAFRKIVNEDEVQDVLSRHGFETVLPEQLPLGRQIAAFKNATCIVGVKGAALTTAAFCAPGTEVLVLSPSGFTDPFFWDLLSPRGLSYSEMYCKADAGAGISLRDINVDLTVLERFLASVGDRS